MTSANAPSSSAILRVLVGPPLPGSETRNPLFRREPCRVLAGLDRDGPENRVFTTSEADHSRRAVQAPHRPMERWERGSSVLRLLLVWMTVADRGGASQPWAAISFFDDRKPGPSSLARIRILRSHLPPIGTFTMAKSSLHGLMAERFTGWRERRELLGEPPCDNQPQRGTRYRYG
jgi:hypothetical protein